VSAQLDASPTAMSVGVQSPPVGGPQAQAPQVRPSTEPVNQALDLRPAWQVWAPSMSTQGPSAATCLGTQAAWAPHPAPAEGMLQNLATVLQTGVPLVGVPEGAQTPVGVPWKASARNPKDAAVEGPAQAGVKQPSVESRGPAAAPGAVGSPQSAAVW
jgi:hypothetical protein